MASVADGDRSAGGGKGFAGHDPGDAQPAMKAITPDLSTAIAAIAAIACLSNDPPEEQFETDLAQMGANLNL